MITLLVLMNTLITVGCTAAISSFSSILVVIGKQSHCFVKLYKANGCVLSLYSRFPIQLMKKLLSYKPTQSSMSVLYMFPGLGYTL